MVALPADENGRIVVYLLNLPKRENVVPLGGHFRIMIGADDLARPAEPLTSGYKIAQWDPDDTELMMQVHVTDPVAIDEMGGWD